MRRVAYFYGVRGRNGAQVACALRLSQARSLARLYSTASLFRRLLHQFCIDTMSKFLVH